MGGAASALKYRSNRETRELPGAWGGGYGGMRGRLRSLRCAALDDSAASVGMTEQAAARWEQARGPTEGAGGWGAADKERRDE